MLVFCSVRVIPRAIVGIGPYSGLAPVGSGATCPCHDSVVAFAGGISALSSLRSHVLTTVRLGGAAVAVSALALGVGLPAAAAAAPSPQVTATLLLRSPNPAASKALAAAGAISRTERLRRLAATVPSASTRDRVTRQASALGLTVDGGTPWSVRVHGSAATVAALTAGGARAADAAELPGVAAIVPSGPVGLSKPRLGPVTGAQFSAAYNSSTAAPPAGSPAVTVATIQFAQWDSAELATYAATAGLPAPGPSTFTPIAVDGGAISDTYGEFEVALDQESIYAVNPYAQQRAYFAPDTTDGYLDALLQVQADALSSGNIVALSTSWGNCESVYNFYVPHFLPAVHQVLGQLLAAGVTVFAASGDSGSYDCATNALDVDYPASDPNTVAVGGTTLDFQAAGVVETAWGAPGATNADFEGSGGGRSTSFLQPAYQSAVAPGAPSRLVPDIAADASDLSPFNIYDQGHALQVWGTSLAAPISAGMLTAELASRGITSGVGDIHQSLYSGTAVTRDVTVGTNGAYTAGPGYDMVTGLGAPNWHAIVDRLQLAPVVSVPAYSAGHSIPVTVTVTGGQSFLAWGTGVGTPPPCTTAVGKPTTPAAVPVPSDGTYTVWAQGYVSNTRCLTATATAVVDGQAPSVVATATQSAKTKQIAFSWTVADAVSGPGTTTAYVLRNGKRVWTGSTEGSGKIVLKRQAGSLYQVVVTGSDKAGHLSKVAKALSVPYDDTSLTFGKGWKRVTSKAALGGRIATSSTKGAAAHLKAYGRTYSLLTTTGPTSGIVEVFVNGKHLRNVSLYSKRSSPQRLVKLGSFGSAAVRSITLVVTGNKGPAAKGSVVNVDGLVAT